ncbi:MAG: hypothetical protein AB1Z22_08750 [Synechococcaceae cyanobacterium]
MKQNLELVVVDSSDVGVPRDDQMDLLKQMGLRSRTSGSTVGPDGQMNLGAPQEA